MNYWRGYMDWPLEKDWKCEICGGYYGLTWGLCHGECRCNQCHAVYEMRAADEKRTVLTVPRCAIKASFVWAARDFFTQTGRSLNEATKEDWINFGVPQSEFGFENEEKEGGDE